MLLAALLTWVLPAGRYQRVEDAETGRTVVVAGTYERVDPRPLGPFEALVAIPLGMADAAGVIFFIFLVGGAFAVAEQTGALGAAVAWLQRLLGDRQVPLIVAVCVVFGLGGALSNTQEEIVAVMPLLLLLARRLGCDPLTAVAMSLGPAGVASAFSPVNPFQASLAQRVADLPLGSGWEFRLAFLIPALALWSWAAVRQAERSRAGRIPSSGGFPSATGAHPADDDTPSGDDEGLPADDERLPGNDEQLPGSDEQLPGSDAGLPGSDAGLPAAGDASGGLVPGIGYRDAAVLALLAVAFGVFVYGMLGLGWDYNRMTALFFGMGILMGLAGGLGLTGTAGAFVVGFQQMAPAAMMVGLARAIFVALDQGRVVDTVVHGLFLPLEDLPLTLSALGMLAAQSVLHVPVSSVSGQAVLTMPVAAPLADLLGMSRQVAVLAYHYGAGLTDIVTPTNGSMMAVLAAAGVSYEDWLGFAGPLWVGSMALAAIAVVLGLLVGFA